VGLRENLTANNQYRITHMENLIVSIISVALIIYLIFTIIRPEKF